MQGSFEEFVRSRGPSLLRYAHLLTGDAGRAEDLVQDALVKLHARWETGTTAPHAYARRTSRTTTSRGAAASATARLRP